MSTRATVDRDVAVANHLAGLSPALAEAKPMHDVVEPALQQRHERVARVSLALDRFVKILAELAFEHAVIVLDLLLLAQVHAVVGELAAALLVHAGRRFRAARSRTWAYRSVIP